MHTQRKGKGRHMDRSAAESPDKEIPCTFARCRRTFISRWALAQHQNWHEEQKSKMEENKRRKGNQEAWTSNPLPRPLHPQLRGPVQQEEVPPRHGNQSAGINFNVSPELPAPGTTVLEQREVDRHNGIHSHIEGDDQAGGGEGGDKPDGAVDEFGDASEAREFDVRNASAMDLKEAWMEFAPMMKAKMGRSMTERVLTFVFHANWARSVEMFQEEGMVTLRAMEEYNEKSTRNQLLNNGFCEKRVQNPILPDSSLDLYVRNPVDVIRKQLEVASEVGSTFYFEPFIHTNRFGERLRGHPMSADLARDTYRTVKYDVMNSTDKDVRWVDGESFVAFIQLYTDASCMSLKTSAFSFYPLHISVLNTIDADREAAIRLGETVAAYLPTAKMWPTAEQTRTEHARKYTVDGEPLTSYDEPDPISAGPGATETAAVSNYKRVAPRPSREILGECLEICLAELRDIAKSALEFVDRDGKRRRAHFAIASYVADTPEVICVTCLTGGYCPRCNVPKDEMWKPGHVGERRMACNVEKSLSEFNEQAERAQALPEKEKKQALLQADKILKDEGLTTRLPFNCDWPFSRIHPFLDPYRVMRVDMMHTFPLGIQKEILRLASLRLKSETLSTGQMTARKMARTFKAARNSILSAANGYLRRIEEEAPAIGLHVDFTRGKAATATDGLFAENGVASMLESKDFKNVAQVMPFVGALIDIMCGSDTNGATVTSVFVKYVDLEAHIMRRGMDEKGHSEGDLTRLEEMALHFKEITYEHFKDYQVSNFNFPKWHAIEHVVSDIREMGHCSSFSADAYEHSHTVFKELNRQGSQRKSTGLFETVSKLSAGEARRSRLSHDYPRKGSDRRDVDVAMLRYLVYGEKPGRLKKGLGYDATVSDACVLATTRNKNLETNFDEIAKVVENVSERMKATGRNLGKSRGEREESRSSDLPAPNQFVAAVGGYALTKKVLDILERRYSHAGTTGVFGLTMHIVKSARVAGFHTPTLDDVVERPPALPELFVAETGFRLAQKIVSALHYSGRPTPLQDNVLVEGSDCNEPDRRQMWVAKVLAFLAVSRSGVGASFSQVPLGPDGGSSDDVAVVRYYEVLAKNKLSAVDEELRCVKLKWARDDNNNEPWIDIIPASSIRGRVHVVPAPKKPSSAQTIEGEAVFAGSHDWKQRDFYINRFRVNPDDKHYHTVDLNKTQ